MKKRERETERERGKEEDRERMGQTRRYEGSREASRAGYKGTVMSSVRR